MKSFVYLTYLILAITAFNSSIYSQENEKAVNKEKKEKSSALSGRIVGLKIGGGPVSVTDFNNFQKNKSGFYVGLSREFLFGKVLGLSVEGNYWLTGYTNDTSFAKVSFNYLSVPVMLNVNLEGFYFAAGIYGAVNLRTSRKIGDDKEYFGFQNNLFQQWDWGAVFNIGFKWRFLGFDVRYVMGLQDVLKFTPEKWRNSGLFFGASLHLMSRKK